MVTAGKIAESQLSEGPEKWCSSLTVGGSYGNVVPGRLVTLRVLERKRRRAILDDARRRAERALCAVVGRCYVGRTVPADRRVADERCHPSRSESHSLHSPAVQRWTPMVCNSASARPYKPEVASVANPKRKSRSLASYTVVRGQLG